MESLWVEVVLIAVAIVANGFFSGSEIALVSARPSRLAQLHDEGVPGAERAIALKQDPDTFLATVQIAITLVGTLASAVGGATAVRALTPWIAELPLSGARWAEAIALGLVIVLITFASLVIGELTPKALALRNPERAACMVAPMLHLLSRLATGPNRLLTLSTRAVLTILGQREAGQPPPVSEEEVKYLVREGAAHGVFERHESDLVQRIFDFTDTPVRSVMIPRPNIHGLDIATPPDQILHAAAAQKRSRLPVFRGSIDEVVGFVTVADLFAAVARGTIPPLERLIRPCLFVPAMMPVGVLLKEFQRRHASLALVVDEFGQIMGLITMEDVLEEIVGEIRDEGEGPGLPFATRLPDGSYLIDATATIRDLREQGGFPLEDSPHYQTLAGFLMYRLGTVPRPGTSHREQSHVFTVVETDGPRIVRVKAQAVTA